MPDTLDKATIQPLLHSVSAELALEPTTDRLSQLTTHFLLLLKWNRKINLTAVRHPEEIAWRHFGESLFVIQALGLGERSSEELLIDVGTGAGFPGLPIKVLCPSIQAVLLEPNQKKSAFLKEVVRQSRLQGIEIRSERVEDFVAENPQKRASLVTMRAVAWSEGLTNALSSVIKTGGRVALLLGLNDTARYQELDGYVWKPPIAIPHSERRVILVGTRKSG